MGKCGCFRPGKYAVDHKSKGISQIACWVAGGMVTLGEPSAMQERLPGKMGMGIGALVVYTSHM